MTPLIIDSLDTWLPADSFPRIIAGPCSIESEQQLTEAASQLVKKPYVTAMRCGLWKPRTRPGGFEGVGDIGLEWIKRIKEKFSIKVCVEAAMPQHIEKGLKAGVDFFWIGARTTGNPFSVAELCEVVRGTGIPLLIKNPMTPDIKLWIGTLERFFNAGCTRLVAVHRGFYRYDQTLYRNDPCWEIPIELQRLFPGLPLFCDPSHITGKKELLQHIAQKAMDLKFSGLMLEVHPHPEVALTDREQQITANELDVLIQSLVIRNGIPEASPNEEITLLRKNIDTLDKELIRIIAGRMEIVRTLAGIKREHRLSILQMKRWEEILGNSLSYSTSLLLDPEFIKRIMEQIHTESIRIQNEIMNQNGNTYDPGMNDFN